MNQRNELPEHLVPLFDNWALWRWLRVRGAGFAASQIASLAASGTTAALEALYISEHNYSELHTRVLTLVAEASRTCVPEEAKPLTKLLRKLRKGTIPNGEYDETLLIPALRSAQQLVCDSMAKIDQSYIEDLVLESKALTEIASCPRFQEAVLWQNPNGFFGVSRVAAQKGHGSQYRQHEQLVARYTQRYCAKNDMIGFFGPQGTGEVTEGRETRIQVGEQFLRKRRVYFEHWAIAALADSLANDAQLRPFTKPRVLSSLRVVGGQLVSPNGVSTPLPDEFTCVLSFCDGETFARDVARQAVVAGIDDDDAVFEILEVLEDKGIVTMTFALPTTRLDVEEVLREQFLALPESARAVGIRAVDELCAAKNRISAAAGDAAALQSALSEMNAVFEARTGAASLRSAGKSYAGRTLIFEECVRDANLELGQDVLDGLRAPLALVLQSARWFTYEVAQQFLSEFKSRYHALLAEDPDREISYFQFWSAIRPLFSDDTKTSAIIVEVQRELRARWAQILNFKDDERRIERSSSELQPLALELFSAPGPGWPAARYHSPDVMIVAKSEDALAASEVTFVLGEVHAGVNTCAVRDYLMQIDDAEELIAARGLDLPEPALIPVVARSRASRVDHIWMVPRDIELEMSSTPSDRPASQVLKVCDLVVTEEAGEITISDRAGRHRFSVLQAMENHLTAEVLSEFTYMPNASHRPRVTIDSVVIGRESWRFAPEQLEFRTLPRGRELFVATRRWARSAGLPEHVFVKVPEENKPIFIDFQSIISVESFAKLVRKASVVAISEMLPDTDELWLPDADGNLYTSELRIVAVDSEAWCRP